MATTPRTEYTIIGSMTVPADRAEAIAEALMDCAADHTNASVSVDTSTGLIDIEVIADGEDPAGALANGLIDIEQVCQCAELPIEFADTKPSPTRWNVEPTGPISNQTLEYA